MAEAQLKPSEIPGTSQRRLRHHTRPPGAPEGTKSTMHLPDDSVAKVTSGELVAFVIGNLLFEDGIRPSTPKLLSDTFKTNWRGIGRARRSRWRDARPGQPHTERRARIDAENGHQRVMRSRLRIIVKETRGYPTGYLQAQSGTIEYGRGSSHEVRKRNNYTRVMVTR